MGQYEGSILYWLAYTLLLIFMVSVILISDVGLIYKVVIAILGFVIWILITKALGIKLKIYMIKK